MAATYLIAQHVADLFRREPRNVGVFVRLDGQLHAKFFAEKEPNNFGPKTRALPAPDTYMQWVRYWRRVMAKRPATAWEEIQETAKEHYQIILGGEVDAIGGDDVGQVTDYLFNALVSEGGIASALGAPDEAEASVRLAESVEDELDKRHLIFKGRNLYSETIKHPVQTRIPVEGKKATHILSFFQHNGHDVIIEPIDLTVRRDKKRMEERAGWASRVFEDIRALKPDTEAIALVSATAEEEKEHSAAYALKLIKPYARVINWQDPVARQEFLRACEKLAKAG